MAGLAVDQAAVVKVDALPVVGVVAASTGTAKVIGRRNVTGLAIEEAAVIIGHDLPSTGDVTVSTGGVIVARTGLVPMAVGTPIVARMVEPVLPPVTGVVATVTAQMVVVLLAVAVRTLRKVGVVEGDRTPIVRGVTARALAGIVVRLDLPSVALDAVGKASVVEDHLLPVIDAVTVGALPSIVLVLQLVAILAVSVPGVVEHHLFPVVDVVAVGTLPGIVVFRRVVRQVAALAIGESSVVKGYAGPLHCTVVAIGTGVRTRLH